MCVWVCDDDGDDDDDVDTWKKGEMDTALPNKLQIIDNSLFRYDCHGDTVCDAMRTMPQQQLNSLYCEYQWVCVCLCARDYY